MAQRRLDLQPVTGLVPPRLTSGVPLPSQATWMGMMQRLQQQYGPKPNPPKRVRSKKKKIKMVKDTVTLAEVFRKLPKTLKTQKVPLTGRLTLNSMLRRLKAGSIKIDALLWS